jgi:hypothetical protein
LGVDFRDETVCLVPKLINEALDATGAELQGQLVTIMDKVNLMTTALDFVYGIELNERNHRVIVYRLPRGVTQRDVEYVRDSLIVYRQHELYIRKLMDEIERIETASSQIFNTLQRGLIDLHRVVKHRIAIPVNQVFPHFMKLSDIWCSLQDQTILMAKINQIMINLQKYIKILAFPDSLAESMIPPGEAPMTDTERLQRTAGQKNIKRRQQRHDHRRHQLPGFQQAQDGVFGFLRVETVGHRRRTLTRESQFGDSKDHEHDFRVFVEGSGRGVRGNTGEVRHGDHQFGPEETGTHQPAQHEESLDLAAEHQGVGERTAAVAAHG